MNLIDWLRRLFRRRDDTALHDVEENDRVYRARVNLFASDRRQRKIIRSL